MFVCSCGNSEYLSVDEIVSNHVMPCAESSSLYARVDRLLDSNDNDKCTAFNELISQENLVCFVLFSALGSQLWQVVYHMCCCNVWQIIRESVVFMTDLVVDNAVDSLVMSCLAVAFVVLA